MTPHSNADADAHELDTLVRDIAHLESVVAGWDDEPHRLAVSALKSAIEKLHREALRRLIRSIKDAPAGLDALKRAAHDPLVHSVLQYHELLRAPQPTLAQRVETALAEVRPGLATHGGDVELAAVRGDVVEVRLLGTCVSCPSSTITLTDGIEDSIKRHCPEITRVISVAGPGLHDSAHDSANGHDARDPLVQLRSPFKSWTRAADLTDIPDGDVLAVVVEGRSVLLSRTDSMVRAYRNACAHLGMPLEDGAIEGDVLTCTYHGFRYLLSTGECLTAPEVQLQRYPVRLEAGSVLVRVRD